MGTTADKLNKLKQTKESIRQSIIAKGVPVSEIEPFSTYSSKIDMLGGGGGDEVSAVNYTPNELGEGDKVWLKKISDTEPSYAYGESIESYSTDYLPIFDSGDNLSFYTIGGEGQKFIYTYQNNKWIRSVQNIASFGYRDRYRVINGEVISYCFGSGGSVLETRETSIVYEDKYYIGYGLFLKNTSGVVELRTENIKLSTLPQNFDNRATVRGFYKDNKLLCSDNYKYRIYDVTDLRNPILIAEHNASIDKGFDIITGLNIGDVVFEDGGNNHWAYKFAEDYSLIPVYPLEGLGNLEYIRINYNNDTEILTAGFRDSARAYSWNNTTKAFERIILPTLDPTPSKTESGDWYLAISKNRTTIAIAKNFYPRCKFHFYKFSTDDSRWYAVDFGNATASSVTGFATGEKDEQGLDKVSTILPPEISAVFEITPQPDSFTIDGEAK